MSSATVESLREQHYNATITRFEHVHDELWVLGVEADAGAPEHRAGQYASLALGYWEPRIDEVREEDLDKRWTKLVRRSYSVSCPVIDADGQLARSPSGDDLEFYVVRVLPTDGCVPGLTPRLALKRAGDRVHLGRKMAGRYTLTPVVDEAANVVFFSTGTGEAPHSVMITDLLRRGHRGPIVSVVCVRRRADLAYLAQHRELEERYGNYRYVPVLTREPGVRKQYIQDLIRSGALAETMGHELQPQNTHVFLCGNPSMIGLPTEVDGTSRYPEPTGVVELLAQRGFTLDRRKAPGNIHYEEYW